MPPLLLCNKLGLTRLLFGSDYPLFSQRRALRSVSTALSAGEFDVVTAENARRPMRL